MRMTPLILLGPPGVGKTHLVNALALTLGVPFVSIAMSTCDDIGDLVGHSLSWKSARPGILANTLIECGFASPVVLVDEIEKAPRLSPNDKPSDVWHSLFEPENSRNFRDQFLGLSLRADCVLWVATANSLRELPESVIDRTLVVTVAPPNPAESRLIAQSIFGAFVDERPGIHKQLPEEALAILAGHTPRTMKKILLVAAGIAAERQSSAIEASDIEAALSVIDMPRNTDRRFGFL
jgi:ATP-dependent Lon protease